MEKKKYLPCQGFEEANFQVSITQQLAINKCFVIRWFHEVFPKRTMERRFEFGKESRDFARRNGITRFGVTMQSLRASKSSSFQGPNGFLSYWGGKTLAKEWETAGNVARLVYEVSATSNHLLFPVCPKQKIAIVSLDPLTSEMMSHLQPRKVRIQDLNLWLTKKIIHN